MAIGGCEVSYCFFRQAKWTKDRYAKGCRMKDKTVRI